MFYEENISLRLGEILLMSYVQFITMIWLTEKIWIHEKHRTRSCIQCIGLYLNQILLMIYIIRRPNDLNTTHSLIALPFCLEYLTTAAPDRAAVGVILNVFTLVFHNCTSEHVKLSLYLPNTPQSAGPYLFSPFFSMVWQCAQV